MRCKDDRDREVIDGNGFDAAKKLRFVEIHGGKIQNGQSCMTVLRSGRLLNRTMPFPRPKPTKFFACRDFQSRGIPQYEPSGDSSNVRVATETENGTALVSVHMVGPHPQPLTSTRTSFMVHSGC